MVNIAQATPPGKPESGKEIVDRFIRKRPVAWVCAIAIVVGAVLHWSNYLLNEWDTFQKWRHPKTFDVKLYLEMRPIVDDMPRIWRVDDGSKREQPYCPVGYLLTVSITNLMSEPTTIVGYEASMKNQDGNWTRLVRIGLDGDQHFYIIKPTLSEATIISIMPRPLDEQLSRTASLKPREPLVGTVFFDDPSPDWPGEEFRFTVRDLYDHQFTSGALSGGQMKTNLSGMSYTVGDKVTDLTDKTKHPYRQHCAD
jgi:hypothetical protein